MSAEPVDLDEPGFTFCLECGEEIPDDDNEAPFCGRCWRMLEEKVHGWLVSPACRTWPKGYGLPLSGKEHAALLRLLDFYLCQKAAGTGCLPGALGNPDTFQAIRSRLKETMP